MEHSNEQSYSGLEIAVTGIACRFPMALNYSEFWNNLAKGQEAVHFFSDSELQQLNIQDELLENPNFVKACVRLEEKECFDAGFFDYRPDEAALMNPDLRIFHQSVWEALEDAGCNPDMVEGGVGLFAGAGDDINWKIYSLITNAAEKIDMFTLSQLNSKDHLASLVSYKLNLKGPVYSVNTGCSTSLVSVHLACRSLLMGECSVAVAGGVYIRTHPESGYLYKEGHILSKDGHCRAFDKDASGTVSGQGAGAVVLKRLKDAIKDDDHIYAVIKGSAINNDGKRKVGYTAPSIEGQASCIRMAHEFGRTDPSSVSYVEAHGTGTLLGDPIEIAALQRVYGTKVHRSCAIGSVKTNIGHADTAAGIAGFIKTVLSLKHRKLLPSLHYIQANPEIDFVNSPFYVNVQLTDWVRDKMPLRAAVSSFGIGGTNAHIIVEESPAKAVSGERKIKLLTFSAKTESSLRRYLISLENFLNTASDSLSLSDLAFTSQVGRQQFPWRTSLCFEDRIGLKHVLKNAGTDIVKSTGKKKAVFMFSGSGSQYVNMGRDIYENDSFFRKDMDEAFSLLFSMTGIRYKEIVFPSCEETNGDTFNEIRHLQPIVFIFGYCLAKRMMSLGIHPECMIGHSLGEYIAACISGVFQYEEVLQLVVKRGQLMGTLAPGIMISAAMSEGNALAYVNEHVSVAAVNGPEQIVFSGSKEAMETLMAVLSRQGISYVKLFTSHAAHSAMIDNVLNEFRMALGKISMNDPQIPFMSNITGEFISKEMAVSPDYWVKHMRETVQFSKGLSSLGELHEGHLFIEIGAGHALSRLLLQHRPAAGADAFNMIRHIKQPENDMMYFTRQLGKLWKKGLAIDWKALYDKDEVRAKIPMPAYSFEKQRYPVEVDSYRMLAEAGTTISSLNSRGTAGFFYTPQWIQSAWLPAYSGSFSEDLVVLFSDGTELSQRLMELFLERDVPVKAVHIGSVFEAVPDGYNIDPDRLEDYEMLFKSLTTLCFGKVRIVHLWNYWAGTTDSFPAVASRELATTTGFESLLFIARQLASFPAVKYVQIDIVVNNMFRMLGTEHMCPSKSLVLGPAKVIPVEFGNMSCRVIDVEKDNEAIVGLLWKELGYSLLDGESEVCIRGAGRFVRKPVKLSPVQTAANFRPSAGDTYLISGAHGGLAAILAEYFSLHFHIKLILLGRRQECPDYMEPLLKKGASVCYIKADITNAGELAAAVSAAELQMGAVKGIIHTAGQVDKGGMILRRAMESHKSVFLPKVSGTACLFTCFQHRKLIFFVNCSALAATIPPFGQVAYAAANIYQDAFADRYSTDYPIISIQWCALNDTGMASDMSGRDRKSGLDKSEIIDVFLKAIALAVPVQIISPECLYTAIKKNSDHIRQRLHVQNTDGFTDGLIKERPPLETRFEQPEAAAEIQLELLWRSFFGLAAIGIDDNFFELGGDSLRALVLCKRMQLELNIETSLADFFRNPTIRAIARRMEEKSEVNDKVRKSIII